MHGKGGLASEDEVEPTCQNQQVKGVPKSANFLFLKASGRTL
jgi:hypothetical protein